MAFLDNSGDIILDAVLTDLGRKRLAEGNFRITQFALGDDEIDYSLYNKDHPSGSAYYDLEILQTPIFEAFTQTNANVNYGLLSFNRERDILYLPSLVLNEKTAEAGGKKLSSNVAFLAVNDATAVALRAAYTDDQVSETGISTDYFLFETGIQNNNDPAGTKDNKDSFITNNGLVDNEMTLRADHRFLNGVFPITVGSRFSYGKGERTRNIDIRTADSPLAATMVSADVMNTRAYVLPSINNAVVNQDDSSEQNLSQINGPRGRVTAFRLTVSPDLIADVSATTPSKYSLYGKTGQTQGSAAGTYDYIDTVVYLNGNTTGANTQLVVRIIRKAS